MEDFILYIGKAALALGAFYLAYLALFQHQKHFLFNRIYLPVSFLVSFLIPLITFTKVNYIQSIPAAVSNSFAFLPEATVANEPQFAFEWYHYLLAIYALGIVVFLLNLLIGHLKAMNIIRFSRLKELFGAQVNLTQKDVHPFSFFSRIVLSEKTLKNPDLKMIVDHEMIHVRERHTLDILFAELLFLFQWFNPFAWLIREAMRNNLEYLTDHQVAQNHNAEAYQLAMVGLAHKKGVAPFLTALNGSQLKNRIIMMKKKTENRYSLLKQLVVLPLLAILVMGLSNKEVKTEIVQEAAQSVQITDATQLIDHLTSFSGIVTDENGNLIEGVEIYSQNGNLVAKTGEDGKFRISPEDNEKSFIVAKEGYRSTELKNDTGKSKEQLLIQLDRIEKSPKGKVISGKITNEDGDGIPAVAVLVKGSTVGTISDFSGNYKIETDKNSTLVFMMIGYAQKEVAIDGKSELDVQLKADGSGKPETAEVMAAKTKANMVKGKVTDENGKPLAGTAVLMKGTSVGTITDINGNYVLQSDDKFGELVFMMLGFDKKETAVNGKTQLDVKLKADGSGIPDEVKVIGYGQKNEATKVELLSNSENPPLYIVDGKEAEKIDELEPDAIESISVLKNESATSLYGDKGKNGVIIITTKAAVEAKMDDALIIVEGVPYDGDINDIDTETIESINVLKGESATERFGPIAKNGAVSIKLKGSAGLNGKSPKLIIDGEEYKGDVNDLDPEKIASMSVFKGDMAEQRFGEGGEDGVIVINTKDYKLDTPDDLRRYIAKSLIYPDKAKKANFSGIAEVAVTFDKNGDITDYSDKKGSYEQNLDEVVVIGYQNDKRAVDASADVEDLKSEVRRVLKKLPASVNIPDFKGETVLVSVKFVLQEK